MAVTLPLSQDDRNRLVEEKQNLQEQNVGLNNANEASTISAAEFLLLDIPSKKQTDQYHVDIYFYEEELKRLIGSSIPEPLQENGFRITDSDTDARIYVNDGRLIVEEGGSEEVNIPIIPTRGYSKSQVVGTDFDIWTRDRYGSTTSESNGSSVFTIDSSNSKIRIKIDTEEREVDFADLLLLPQVDIPGGAVGTTIQALINQYPSLELISENTEPFSLEDGNQLLISVDGGGNQTATFNTGDFSDINSATAQEIADVLNTDWTGITASDDSGAVKIVFDGTSKLQITDSNGNPNNQIGLSILPALNDTRFSSMVCGFNENLNTFTVTSGISGGGTGSDVEVIAATSDDMRSTIGFLNQKKILGKYQNNILNVEIDGTAEEIFISDFRKCESDVNLGDNNDDIGFYWSGPGNELGYIGNNRVGPLFCSGIDNGNEVAQSIQAGLRQVGSGGFENAICHYFDDESVFTIYSGTFGSSSSAKVLAASDSLRDARTLLGYNPPDEEIGNEEYYDTIGTLTTELATYPNVTISDITSETDRLSHSILYLPTNGVKIADNFQNFIVATTQIYDNGSRGLPKLYPDGFVNINSQNKYINFTELPDVERTIVIREGDYAEGQLALEIEDAFNTASGYSYTVEFDQLTKKFTISMDGSYLGLLWNTGEDAYRALGHIIGFDISADDLGSTSYTSDNEVQFSNPDFFNPVFVSQFYGEPLAFEDGVDEQSALLLEEDLLSKEGSILTALESATSYDNEVLLDGWESLAEEESDAVDQEDDALRLQRGAYASHISDSDPIIVQKTAAINNLAPNKSNLDSLLSSHANILNLQSEDANFVPGVDFTSGGSEVLNVSISSGTYDKRIYNLPPPLVKYQSGGGEHIASRFSPVGLFGTSFTITPEGLPSFQLTNTRTGVEGYSYSTTDSDSQYSINDTSSAASFLTANSEPYNLAPADTLSIKVNDETTQTIKFRETVFLNVGDNFQTIIDTHPAGTMYVIRAGTHREQKVIPKDNDTFIGEVGAIMNGSRVLTGWTPSGGNYLHQLSSDITPGLENGTCSGAATCVYPEQLYVYDSNTTTQVVLERVASIPALAANKWYFDETASPQEVYTFDDWSAANYTVELGTTPYAFGYDVQGGTGGQYTPERTYGSPLPLNPSQAPDIYDSGDLYAYKPRNVIVKNIIVEKYANPAQTGAIGYHRPGLDWIIEDNEVRWNHGVGIKFKGQAIVRGNNVHHNAQLGIGCGDGNRNQVDGGELQEWGYWGGYAGYGALVESNEIAFNRSNVIGIDPAWEGGGTKFAQCFDLIIRNNYVHDNDGAGIWLDFAYDGTIVESNLVEDNNREGILVEITSPTTTVRCNTCKNNGVYITTSNIFGSQIMNSNSDTVNIYRNYCVAAIGYGNGITIRHESRNVDGTTINAFNTDTQFNHVTSLGNGLDGLGFSGGQTTIGADKPTFYNPAVNTFDNNTYHVASGTGTYWRWDQAPFVAPWPPYVNFATWQGTYLQDPAGTQDTNTGFIPTFQECIPFYSYTPPSYASIPTITDIDAVTASEVVDLMNSVILGFIGTTASVDGSQVDLVETYGTGDTSKLEITGGTSLTVLGYSTGTTFGQSKNNLLKVDIDGDTSKPAIALTGSTSPILGATVAADIQSKLQAIGTGGYTNARCTFDETTAFQYFDRQLRIISGTVGPSSTVDVTASVITITSSVNDRINFMENAFTELTATLTPGNYNPTTLATEVQTQLNSAGSSTYTVSYSGGTNKMTVTSNGSGGSGVFTLLFFTGTDILRSAADVLGYFATDHTGSLSYVSDGTVKSEGAALELGYDAQTTEQGHNVIAIRATLNDTDFTSTLDLDTGGGSRLDLDIDITTPPNDNVAGLTSTINSEDYYEADLGPAFLLGRVASEFRLENNDTLIVNPNGSGNQTFTFSFTKGESFSDSGGKTRIYSGVNDRIKISINGATTTEIILGSQSTANKIAAAIQREVRSIVQSTKQLQAAYSQFRCWFDGANYVLNSGTGGTGSSVVVTDAATNNGADDLKLGVANGGTETAGTGDGVNSSFMTITEVINKINATAVDFIAAGPNYLKLTSLILGGTTRIQVSGTTLITFGFDNNDDNNPTTDLATVNSTVLVNFTNINIQDPNFIDVDRGWETDKGNVVVSYSVIDDSEIQNRNSIISTRVPTIAPRKPQITARAADIQAALTPAIYEDRRDAVQFRLNKKTGSYIKVGDELNAQDFNDDTIAANTTAINEIDALL